MDPLAHFPVDPNYGWICVLMLVLLHEPSSQEP